MARKYERTRPAARSPAAPAQYCSTKARRVCRRQSLSWKSWTRCNRNCLVMSTDPCFSKRKWSTPGTAAT
eukprot:706948-Pyramimonas_sp.AAC.1